MRHLIFILCFFINFKLLYSNDNLTNSKASSEILPSNSVYKVNNDYYFNIRIVLEKGWKTYWKNPGDAGLPIQIDWGNSEPDDYEILFPYPKGSIDNSILTIGYQNTVNFPVRIKFKNNQDKIKQIITLNYLVCKEICIPISEKKQININKENIKISEEFISTFKKVPRNNLSEYEIYNVKFLGSNKLKASLRSNEDFQLESIFVYSEESSLTVNILDKSKNIIEISSETPLEALTKPIQIVFDNGSSVNEIQFIKNNLRQKHNIIYFYFIAFIGGLILNFMPCVLPIISIKLLSFSSMIQQNKKKIRLSSLIIVLGIISSFLFLGLLVIFLKTLGSQVGWGFHFQNKAFLIFITVIIFLFTLNLLGYFELLLPRSLNDKFNNFITNNSKYKEFLGGVFSTLLATPCSAPFLGTAVGFSMLGSPIIIISIFFFISIGFSIPYILCILFPNIIKVIPKPGEWMIKFRFFLGFLLLLSTGWLLNLLELNLIFIFVFLSIILIASIIKGKFKKQLFFISFTIILLSSTVSYLNKSKENLKWEKFNESNVYDYIKKNEIVFLDVTADWCITCQINKITTINSKKINRIFLDNEIKLIQADWTKKDPKILEFISKFGRFGIPVNIIFSKKFNEGILLPEILSQDILTRDLRKVLNEN